MKNFVAHGGFQGDDGFLLLGRSQIEKFLYAFICHIWIEIAQTNCTVNINTGQEIRADAIGSDHFLFLTRWGKIIIFGFHLNVHDVAPLLNEKNQPLVGVKSALGGLSLWGVIVPELGIYSRNELSCQVSFSKM